MPNREVIEKWVAALESGEYSQTTGKLHRAVESPAQPKYYREAKPAGMCCLGVLCDLAVKEGVIPPPRSKDDNGDQVMEYPTGPASADSEEYWSDAFPTPAVVGWAGLASENPYVKYQDPAFGQPEEGGCDCESCTETEEYQLSELNDSEGLSFAEIAAVLRDNYLTEQKAEA